MFLSLSLVDATEFSPIKYDREWLRLLHYYPRLLGGYKSEATAKSFFLTEEGTFSPQNELEEFIRQVGDSHIAEELHPVCRFPARIDWLRRHYPRLAIADKNCTKLSEFKKRIDGKSASVVFSSYYLNNPSSSFGHTFIRIGKEEKVRDDGKINLELLDTGINYGASTGDAGPFLYFFGGLGGYFSGTFTAIPYYYKVREYNDFETRDLWTYHLNLSEQEVTQLINHVWELGHNTFDYYFLTKNCSYHVFSILEAVKPEVDLLKEMSDWYIIPSETLKTLVKNNLVKEITFRPSARTSFERSTINLSEKKRILVKKLGNGENVDLGIFTPEEKVLILDASINFIDYKYAKEILKKEEFAQAIKRPLLFNRASIPISSESVTYAEIEKKPPHTGHGSNRLLVSLGKTNEAIKYKNFIDVDWRFAAQDLLDNDDTYPSFNKLEIGRISLRYDFNHKARLNSLTLLETYSLGSWNEYVFSPAWKVRAGSWLSERGEQRYQTTGFQAGAGVGKDFKSVNLFFIPHLESAYVYGNNQHVKLAYGFDLGFAMRVKKDLKFLSLWEWRDKKWDEDKWKNEMRWASSDFGAGIAWTQNVNQKTKEFSFHILSYL